VLEHDEVGARLVASGSERAEEFSMSRLADLYLGRYEGLVERAEPRRGRPGGTMRSR
jgi:hypothetical protein